AESVKRLRLFVIRLSGNWFQEAYSYEKSPEYKVFVLKEGIAASFCNISVIAIKQFMHFSYKEKRS
ncbi:MAG: hypothetical protein P4N41_11075, partial [Negativicutes bacterium]|nr:hypothetical protein [Negativicutes bacterium]